jgi:hypothetical protein
MPAQLRIPITHVLLAEAFEEMSLADAFGFLVAFAEFLAEGEDLDKSALADILLKALENYGPIE